MRHVTADKPVELAFLSPEIAANKMLVKMLDLFDDFSVNPDGTYMAFGKLTDIEHPFGPVLHMRRDDGPGLDIRLPWRLIIAVISGPAVDLKRQVGFSEVEE